MYTCMLYVIMCSVIHVHICLPADLGSKWNGFRLWQRPTCVNCFHWWLSSTQGFTPLHKAAELEDDAGLNIVNILLAVNANVGAVNDAQQTPLHVASLNGNQLILWYSFNLSMFIQGLLIGKWQMNQKISLIFSLGRKCWSCEEVVGPQCWD